MDINLGDLVTDNIGNEWRLAVRQENWRRMGVVTYMLIEESGTCGRYAQCNLDGSGLTCVGSAVVKQLVAVKEKYDAVSNVSGPVDGVHVESGSQAAEQGNA